MPRCQTRLSSAPVDPAQLRGATGEIPVAAEGAHPRRLRPRHRDVARHPVFAVADDDILALRLAADRRHHPLDDLRDGEYAGFSLDAKVDRHLADTEEAAHQDLEQPGRASGPSGED